MRKAVFFDIDGTIWNEKNYIPDSTREAIARLRKNGHLAFLCSGRSKSFVQAPELLSIGFDGFVLGCGTHVEMNEKMLYEHIMTPETAKYGLEVSRSYGFRPIFEGPEYLYMDDSEFGPGDLYGDKLRRDIPGHIVSIVGHEEDMIANKFSCATENANVDACYDVLKAKFDFLIHNPYVVEIIPKGHNKATGIAKVCEYTKIDVKDSIAVGDSTNDLDMLRFAGLGIAMGNGSDNAKKAAGYVTDSLENDGLYKAMEHFGLI